MERLPSIIIDQSSFRAIYDLYYEAICRFLNFYTRDLFTIEDVVQEVFIKLWENRDFLEIRCIKMYLYTSARNKMLNYLRNEINQTAILEQWHKEEIEKTKMWECYDLDEFSTLLNNAVDSLPEKCKKIFIRNKWGKLSYKQIAELSDISVKTVETQMSIALKRIREYILAYYKVLMISWVLFSSL